MKSTWEAQEAISANLARSAVTGHRSEKTVFQVPDTKSLLSLSDPSKMNRSVAPIQTQRWIDFTQGILQPTENPNHFAIQGEAFFSIQKPDGTVAYTRNGEFHRSVDGYLVQPDGSRLLLQGNAPVMLNGEEEVSLTGDGVLFQGEAQLGRLALSRFEHPEKDLHQIESGQFLLKDGKQVMEGPAASDRVVQGYLEKSNTSSVQQMVEMIEIMRAYEANQKMATTQDQTTGKLIQTIGS